jgi:hypothetical protein
MAKHLEELRITKADNGGHTVRHEFKREVVKKSGAMSGGMYSERPPSEEHSFGPEEAQQHAVLSHIAKALGFGKGGKAPAAAEAED